MKDMVRHGSIDVNTFNQQQSSLRMNAALHLATLSKKKRFSETSFDNSWLTTFVAAFYRASVSYVHANTKQKFCGRSDRREQSIAMKTATKVRKPEELSYFSVLVFALH
jgi:hypothetical protein